MATAFVVYRPPYDARSATGDPQVDSRSGDSHSTVMSRSSDEIWNARSVQSSDIGAALVPCAWLHYGEPNGTPTQQSQ